jgi:oligopeptidase B
MKKSQIIGVVIALAVVMLSARLLNTKKPNSEADMPTVKKSDQPIATAVMPAPIAKRVDAKIESEHGTRIDPYHWLRDDKRENPEMLAYLSAENDYKKAYFERLSGRVKDLTKELRARIKEDESTVPTLENGFWYYTRYEQGQQYPIFARRKGTMTDPEQILLDGNALAGDSAYFSVGNLQVSADGKTMAYAVDYVGRRQYSIKFKNLETNADIAGVIEQVSGDMVWAADNQTLFYTNEDEETLLPYQLFRHTLGADPKSATLVYQEKDNTFYLSISSTKSERYLVMSMNSTLTSEHRILRADDPSGEFKMFRARERDVAYSIDHMDGQFYILSNIAALNPITQKSEKSDNFQILTVKDSANFGDAKQWQSLVPHDPSVFIEEFELFNGKMAIGQRSDGLAKVRVLDLATQKSELIKADDPSYVMNILSTPDLASGELRYRYDSLTAPGQVFALDLQSGKRALLKQDSILGEFDASLYESQYLHATAKDGTQIPISVVYKKTTALDGTAPLYVYAYGSYGASMDPYFNSNRLSLLDRGFVYAIAHIRGGQEMGRKWYEDGKLLKKINTFTDFIDVTDHLTTQKFGAKDKVFAMGGSAGGLLMGAIANMAPEKYKGIVAHVPFVDVVSTMLDESIPLTTGEFDEWGNPKTKVYYDYMLSYSPYDQVSAQSYPAMLVTTGLHDSQVQYWEPAKWVAKLRHMKTDSNPLLFKVNMEAGHGGRSGRFDRLGETAEEFAFVMDLAGK